MASSQDSTHTDFNIRNAGIRCVQKPFETTYTKRYANYRQCWIQLRFNVKLCYTIKSKNVLHCSMLRISCVKMQSNLITGLDRP